METTSFCHHCYIHRYPDVHNVFGDNPSDTYRHYVQHGKMEGRDPKCSDPTHSGDMVSFLKSFDFTPPPAPEISIILVTYNHVALTYQCLLSLYQLADRPFELIIIDNASTDQTRDLLTHLKGVKMIFNASNLHFLRAVNQARHLACGKYILLLNNDTIVQSNTLTELRNTFDRYPNAGAVGGCIILMNGKLQEAGSFLFPDGSACGYGRGDDPFKSEYQFERPVDYCSGCLLMIRKSLFDQFNGFDERYIPAYYEETDLCARLWENGYQVIYQPRATIKHVEGGSTSKADSHRYMLNNREVFTRLHPDFLRSCSTSALEGRMRSNPRQKRVLWIDARIPSQNLGAGFPRAVSMIRAIVELGYFMTVFSVLPHVIDWNTVYIDLPRCVEIIAQTSLQKFLSERCDYYRYIIVSRDITMQAFQREAVNINLSQSRIIYDAEAIVALRNDLQKKVTSNAPSALSLEAEVALAKNASDIITVSPQEALIFKQHGYSNTTVIGHYLDPTPTPNSFQSRNGFLFIGDLLHSTPNIDSIHWFLQTVWPSLISNIPNVHLTLIGMCSSQIKTLNSPDIHVLGQLSTSQVVDQINQHRVFIAPTRFASGIPHKVHFASAHGIPVVATDLLVKQLQWTPQEDILVATETSDFIQQCLTLYNDEQVWNRLRNSALQRIISEHSPLLLEQRLNELLTK